MATLVFRADRKLSHPAGGQDQPALGWVLHTQYKHRYILIRIKLQTHMLNFLKQKQHIYSYQTTRRGCFPLSTTAPRAVLVRVNCFSRLGTVVTCIRRDLIQSPGASWWRCYNFNTFAKITFANVPFRSPTAYLFLSMTHTRSDMRQEELS